MAIIRTYSDLSALDTFDDRYNYLKLGGGVGSETFGHSRHLNQSFYKSYEWNDVRRHVILRDNACDLGLDGFDIHEEVIVHHMNPMSVKDIIERERWILDPEYLITTKHGTHNAIHYGTESLPRPVYTERTPNDTKLW